MYLIIAFFKIYIIKISDTQLKLFKLIGIKLGGV